MSRKLLKLLTDLKEQEALDFVKNALEKGVDPMDLLREARAGMSVIGQKYSSKEYFIPDLVYSAEILKGIVKILEPHLKKEEETERLGKVIIGTVAGDIHDIGKDLVVFMLKVSGFVMGNGAFFDEAKPENVHAMIDFTKEYGVYK